MERDRRERDAPRLATAFVRGVSKPGKSGDQHGLILRVQPYGSKQWIWRGTGDGRRRDLGLGGYPYVSLAEARADAFAYRKGGDPISLRSSGVPTSRGRQRPSSLCTRRGVRAPEPKSHGVRPSGGTCYPPSDRNQLRLRETWGRAAVVGVGRHVTRIPGAANLVWSSMCRFPTIRTHKPGGGATPAWYASRSPPSHGPASIAGPTPDGSGTLIAGTVTTPEQTPPPPPAGSQNQPAPPDANT